MIGRGVILVGHDDPPRQWQGVCTAVGDDTIHLQDGDTCEAVPTDDVAKVLIGDRLCRTCWGSRFVNIEQDGFGMSVECQSCKYEDAF